MSERATRHLFLQYTCAAAHDHQLLFLLANQRQRHAACQVSAARAKAGKEQSKKLLELVNNPSFQEKLAAVEAGDANAIEEVNKKLLPLIAVPGGEVPNGPCARRAALAKLYAQVFFQKLCEYQ